DVDRIRKHAADLVALAGASTCGSRKRGSGGLAPPRRRAELRTRGALFDQSDPSKDYATLFLVRIRADVCPELVDLGVREHVLPGRHLVPAVTHCGAELCAIVGCQSAQIRKLTRAHQPVPVTHCVVVVVDRLAGIALRLVGHPVLRTCRRRGQEYDAERERGSGARAKTLHKDFPIPSPGQNGGRAAASIAPCRYITCRTARKSTALRPWERFAAPGRRRAARRRRPSRSPP